MILAECEKKELLEIKIEKIYSFSMATKKGGFSSSLAQPIGVVCIYKYGYIEKDSLYRLNVSIYAAETSIYVPV